VLIDYVLKLTLAPGQMTEHDLALLREVNFSDSAIHYLVAITAYFNFVNRIASVLGVDLE
jgi:alkylhydroperoxidase family enzyme